MIANECAAQDPGQPVNLCGKGSMSETNSLGANVNIDLCMDRGRVRRFFWESAVGDCGWDGPAGGLYVRLACDEIAGKRSPTERSM